MAADIHAKILKRHLTLKKEQNFDAINSALFALGSPQNKLKIIHVAGTNGKGSVCAVLQNVLSEAGYKVGVFTSPHLICPTERITVGGLAVTKRKLNSLIAAVLKAETKELNYFEILTAAAYLHFARERVDYAVIEAGIGGMMDATNVAPSVISIITSVALDHRDVLGGTISKIAAQKAGIIKTCGVCVCGPLPPAAAKAVVRTSCLQKAKTYFVSPPPKPVFNRSKQQLEFYVGGIKYSTPLIGVAQPLNAALVIKAAELLGIKQAKIKRALSKAKISGRFEIIKRKNGRFIIDGAHNPAALSALAQTLDFTYPRYSVVYASMGDKDYKQGLKTIGNRAQRVYLLPLPAPRAAGAEELFDALPSVYKKKTLKITLSQIKNLQDETVVITGSFYLAGQILKNLHFYR